MNELFFFKQQNCGKPLYLDKIVYFATKGNYTKVHLTYGNPITLGCSLISLLPKLPGSLFAQINRSTIVALRYITEIHIDLVKTSLGDLTVTKQFRKPLRDKLNWLE